MPERATVTQVTDIGIETTENTAVATLTRLTRTEISIEPNMTFDVLRRMGYRFASDSIVGRKWSALAVRGKPAYDELAWFFNLLIDTPTASTPGGATNARQRVYTPSSVRENLPSTFTARQGDTYRAMQVAGSFLTGFGINWDADKVDLSGAGMARKMTDDVQLSTNEVQSLSVVGGTATSGNFGTLTVVNPQTGASGTTAAIAFNATAGAVQTALEALSNVDTGEIVATGGPLPGTPIALEFRKSFGAANVATITVAASTLDAGTATVTTTTPGVPATETEGVVIESNHIKVYADTTSGGLGGTALTRMFSGSLNLNNWRNAFFTVNRDNAGSMAGKVPTPIEGKLQLTLMGDSQWTQFYTGADTGNNPYWFIRFEAIGGLIESGQSYTLYIDLACKVSGISPLKDVGGVYGADVSFDVIHNSGWAKAAQITLKNGVATVA